MPAASFLRTRDRLERATILACKLSSMPTSGTTDLIRYLGSYLAEMFVPNSSRQIPNCEMLQACLSLPILFFTHSPYDSSQKILMSHNQDTDTLTANGEA